MLGPAEKVRPPVLPVGVRLKLTRVWLLSLAGPVLRLVAKLGTVCAPASSFTVGALAGRVKLGGSLTAETVIVKDCAALVLTFGGVPLLLSVSVTLKVAVPLAFAAGV